MRRDGGGDIDEIELLLRQHLLGVGIARRRCELIAGDRQPLGIAIANRDDRPPLPRLASRADG